MLLASGGCQPSSGTLTHVYYCSITCLHDHKTKVRQYISGFIYWNYGIIKRNRKPLWYPSWHTRTLLSHHTTKMKTGNAHSTVLPLLVWFVKEITKKRMIMFTLMGDCIVQNHLWRWLWYSLNHNKNSNHLPRSGKYINSLVAERCKWNLWWFIFDLILTINGWGTSCKIALKWLISLMNSQLWSR